MKRNRFVQAGKGTISEAPQGGCAFHSAQGATTFSAMSAISPNFRDEVLSRLGRIDLFAGLQIDGAPNVTTHRRMTDDCHSGRNLVWQRGFRGCLGT
jgi:hypothetical protein